MVATAIGFEILRFEPTTSWIICARSATFECLRGCRRFALESYRIICPYGLPFPKDRRRSFSPLLLDVTFQLVPFAFDLVLIHCGHLLLIRIGESAIVMVSDVKHSIDFDRTHDPRSVLVRSNPTGCRGSARDSARLGTRIQAQEDTRLAQFFTEVHPCFVQPSSAQSDPFGIANLFQS
jgi:hypothetical protein